MLAPLGATLRVVASKVTTQAGKYALHTPSHFVGAHVCEGMATIYDGTAVQTASVSNVLASWAREQTAVFKRVAAGKTLPSRNRVDAQRGLCKPSTDESAWRWASGNTPRAQAVCCARVDVPWATTFPFPQEGQAALVHEGCQQAAREAAARARVRAVCSP